MESTTTATGTDGIFCTAPADAFPPGAPPVVHIEIDGQPRWIIRKGADLEEVVAELDRIGTHLVRHGIWRQQRDDEAPPRLRHVS